MKVFFIPNYFYLNLSVFENVVKHLKEKGIVSYILKLPGMTDIPADAYFNHAYFECHNLNLIEPPIFRVPDYQKGILSKLRLLFSSFRNLREIRKFLGQQEPDVVVVASDLGNLNIRFLMDACRYRGIPVVIVYTCDIPKANNKHFLDVFYSQNMAAIFKSELLSYFRALLFVGVTPGKYSLDSTLCVASEDIRQELIARGIKKHRIFVSGMPFSNYQLNVLPQGVLKEQKMTEDFKLIVFFTECIQNIYGREYTDDMYIKIAKIVEDLPNAVQFMIKLHPLEPSYMETFIREIFEQSRCKVIKNNNAEEMLAVADLSIAHFSRVLITAALMRRRFLSMNITNDRERTFISDKESEILEITSYEDLRIKINKALEEDNFRLKMDNAVKSISNRYINFKSFDEIVSVILNAPGKYLAK